MVRVSVRVILDCDLTLICEHCTLHLAWQLGLNERSESSTHMRRVVEEVVRLGGLEIGGLNRQLCTY